MPCLVCVAGDDKGLCVELSAKPQLLGRGPDCQIRCIHALVSREHCRLTAFRGRLYLEDLGSHNGVRYRGKCFKSTQLKLEFGGQFAIGEDVFLFLEDADQYRQASGEVTKLTGEKSREGAFEDAYSQTVYELRHRRKKTTLIMRLKTFLRLVGRKPEDDQP